MHCSLLPAAAWEAVILDLYDDHIYSASWRKPRIMDDDTDDTDDTDDDNDDDGEVH